MKKKSLQPSAGQPVSTMARAGAASTGTFPPIVGNTSRVRLVLYFLIWKFALLLIAAASPGPGYDTSSQLLFASDGESTPSSGLLAKTIQHFAIKLTRWDAIYFTSASAKGLIYEQQWAFSPVFAKTTALLARVLPLSLCTSITCHAVSGILISHVTHLLAVLVLHALVLSILPSTSRPHRIAFTTACLHILSPAGLFLSAAYGESTFAFLNFSGMLCYALSTARKSSRTSSSIYTLLAGTFFALATLIRSNGLFSGLIFLWDAISLAIPVLTRPSSLFAKIPRLAITIISGSLIALAYLAPQYLAYIEFCSGGATRPWCEKTLPSIYSFVQSHYWNVGLLRYWTLSNLPLFALAAPMLIVLTTTAVVCFTDGVEMLGLAGNVDDGKKPSTATTSSGTGKLGERELRCGELMRKFALPQFVLALLALTTFHVQIINRISSGYPIWYLVVAIAMDSRGAVVGKAVSSGKRSIALRWTEKYAEWIVRAGMVYAVVQGGLFASFMPPA